MTTKYFQATPNLFKPYALMDLDDTLFQTQRKIDAWNLPTSDTGNLVCATVNKKGEPLSFMTSRQASFFNWLLVSTELIVVTARDRDEIRRVKLPFNSWQVLTHGAIIVDANGQLLDAWQRQVYKLLAPLQDSLNQLTSAIIDYDEQLVFTPHSDSFDNGANTEELTIYLAIKHAQKDHDLLADLAQQIPKLIANFSEHFYVHVNANNLAILPHAIHKQHAVQFLLGHYLNSNRPSFGFGDSLADLPFLQLLDWYGMPNHGQLHQQFSAR